ncbi:sugar ABC transporter permease [Jiangella aurantiaca]|uniref:Sugar ABC transporter permease n=1 Tax=Jiangella aurantiaca TaxID=2530373 RepID=A0A4V2YSR7_9ACTN|nr:sugar ABC transporter permease [Jiangella aurantiaca]TDD71017.1 sugar ABC transporter permease [Jiangella aurantiaca]
MSTRLEIAPRIAPSGTTSPAARRPFPWFKYLAVAPLAVVFGGLVAYPVGLLVWMAFGRVRLVAGEFRWESVGLDNFARMLDDETFLISLKNSAVFITATVVLTLVLGIVLALATDGLVRGRQIAQNVVIWPAIVAPVVISVVWLLILSPQIGLLNRVLVSLGADPQAWLGDNLGAMASIIVVDVWHWTPIVFLFVYTALRGIDPSVLEAASVDGAGYLRKVRHVVLPLLAPAIAGAAAIRLIMGVKAFDEMYLLTFGGPGTATTVITIYLRSVFFDAFEYGYGAALSITVVGLVLGVLILSFVVRSLIRRTTRGY